MGEYISLLTLPESWEFFQKIFNLSRESVRTLERNPGNSKFFSTFSRRYHS